MRSSKPACKILLQLLLTPWLTPADTAAQAANVQSHAAPPVHADAAYAYAAIYSQQQSTAPARPAAARNASLLLSLPAVQLH
jgi:hypothetical protein